MNRLLEIDFIKGIAVILMMIFHVFYLPKYMGLDISSDTLFLKCIARISQFIFITLVGVNMIISHQNYSLKEDKKLKEDNKSTEDKKLKNHYSELYNKNNTFKQIIRAGYIFLAGMCITLITYLLFDDWYVKFGILHFIGFSILILFKFVDNNKVLIPLNILILSLWGFKNMNNNFKMYEYFEWVPKKLAFITGLYNIDYKAMDHFPLIPWLSVLINGILIGKILYKDTNRKFKSLQNINDTVEDNRVLRYIGYLGQYSFRIYLIHYVLIYLFYKYIYSRFGSNNYESII
jgi:uncharacterized membrane protein